MHSIPRPQPTIKPAVEIMSAGPLGYFVAVIDTAGLHVVNDELLTRGEARSLAQTVAAGRNMAEARQ